VVSFGNAFFFRGQERPKPFLVPVSDYQVFEVKETRVVLKNATHERNIKIGGGREAFKPAKEAPVEKNEEEPKDEASTEAKPEKKRERRRNRRRKVSDDKKDSDTEVSKEGANAASEAGTEGPVVEGSEGEKIAPPMFTSLLPPPAKLISEQLDQIRERAAEAGAIIERPAPVVVAKEEPVKEEAVAAPEEVKEPEAIAVPEEAKKEEAPAAPEEKAEEVPSLVPEESSKDDSFFS
jgi:hypothetical protein